MRTSSTLSRSSASACGRRDTMSSWTARRPRSPRSNALLTQLGTLFQEGYRVSNGDVKTAAAAHRHRSQHRSARVLSQEHANAVGQATHCSQNRQPAPLPRRDRAERHRVRHRTRGHRQDVPRDGAGGDRFCWPSVSPASFWRARPSRPARSSAFFQAICRKR